MKNKLYNLLLFLAITPAALLVAASPNRSSYPDFDVNKDILVAQFDNRTDADDLHSIAALGSMLQHRDFYGVNVYAVLGATGTQVGGIIDSISLMELVWGPEGTNWTDARSENERLGNPNSRWINSVARIKDKVKPILEAGGNVWVQEAGQSHITADWIKALRDDGTPLSLTKNIFVVQHSWWNAGKTRSSDQEYMEENATYIRIEDGNHSSDDYGFNSRATIDNDTADYETDDYDSPGNNDLDEHRNLRNNAKTAANPNATTRSYWAEADRIIEVIGFNESHSVISSGGLDFSDCVENWYIFQLGTPLDTVDEFWNRYVMNSATTVDPTLSTSAETNGTDELTVTAPAEDDSENLRAVLWIRPTDGSWGWQGHGSLVKGEYN